MCKGCSKGVKAIGFVHALVRRDPDVLRHCENLSQYGSEVTILLLLQLSPKCDLRDQRLGPQVTHACFTATDTQ